MNDPEDYAELTFLGYGDVGDWYAPAMELVAECRRLRAHSVILNTVSFQLHDALGLIPEGADSHYGDIVSNLPELCRLVRLGRNEVGGLIGERNALSDMVDRLTTERDHALGDSIYFVREAATEKHAAQLMYLEQQRWQELAEDLWEELQEWHDEGCMSRWVTTAKLGDCTCHRILAAKWDEITNAANWADEEEL